MKSGVVIRPYGTVMRVGRQVESCKPPWNLFESVILPLIAQVSTEKNEGIVITEAVTDGPRERARAHSEMLPMLLQGISFLSSSLHRSLTFCPVTVFGLPCRP